MVVPVWCVSTRVLPRASFSGWVLWTAVVVGWEVECMSPIAAGTFGRVGLVGWPWPMEASSLAVSVMKGLWSVPAVVVIMWLKVQYVMVAWCYWLGNFLLTVLDKVTKAATVITLHIGAVVTNVTCLAAYKTLVILWHYIDCRGC